jgi:hypothetical protein
MTRVVDFFQTGMMHDFLGAVYDVPTVFSLYSLVISHQVDLQPKLMLFIITPCPSLSDYLCSLNRGHGQQRWQITSRAVAFEKQL